MGQNNWHDVAKLPYWVVGMNISGSKKKICGTEKAKRASIPKTWGTRAKTKLAIVHTDVLGPIQQESHEDFAMQWASSTVTAVLGYTQRSQKMRFPQSYNDSLSIMAGLARWPQTGL